MMILLWRMYCDKIRKLTGCFMRIMLRYSIEDNEGGINMSFTDSKVISDSTSKEDKQYLQGKRELVYYMKVSVKDIIIMLLILVVATLIGCLFWELNFTEANIITVYILAVLLVSLFTISHLCSVISSLAGVLLFNFFFTEPRLTLHAYAQGYPVTFAIMLTAALIIGTLAQKLKNHAKESAQAAFRTKLLFDTNQLLYKAEDENEIINITASQLVKLLERDVIVYPEADGKLCHGYLFMKNSIEKSNPFATIQEKEIARWVFQHGKRAGATTNTFSDVENLYLSIRINKKVYGVIGIRIDRIPMDSFENSVLLSILGECALAIENIRNAKEKEQAALLAQKEQLRANLLRAISHDLRTPLTSISGNASNLISNYKDLDEDMKIQMFTDIYDDSNWLIGLVENLLSVTRIEEGRLNFNVTTEVVDEVIEEALRHIDRKRIEHEITVDYGNEILLAQMDAKLILQVIINIVDNAIKYTPSGSFIHIKAEKKENWVSVSIEDNGSGIQDALKPRIFEMFFTGDNKIADGRRSLGLGLALCKAIIDAHGGELTLADNKPHGCVFAFTLPLGEVNINE